MERILSSPQVQADTAELKRKYEGKTCLVAVDSCQRLSGAPLKLLAFEQLLVEYPVYGNKVILILKCIRRDEARAGDQEYSSREIRQLVKRITDKHGPVVDYEEVESLSLAKRLPLWLVSSVYINTSVREGLNLQPLEYVFARQQDPGVVLASEFSACCSVLNGALRINPWNMRKVVQTMDAAFTMSLRERKGRQARDLKYIVSKTSAAWTRNVLQDMFYAAQEPNEELTMMEDMESDMNNTHFLRAGGSTDFQELEIRKVALSYRNTKRRVFLLDYGGTLIERENIGKYVKKDLTAVTGRRPTEKMLKALRTLAADPANTVFVISGVSQANLTTALGNIPRLGLAAMNGALYSWATGGDQSGAQEDSSDSPKLIYSPPERDSSANRGGRVRAWSHLELQFEWEPVKAIAEPLLEAYTSRTNGSSVKYLDSSIAWNFRSCDPEWGLMQAKQLQNELEEALKDYPVEIIRKKGIVEVVPHGLHKGVVARQILLQDAVRNHRHPDFVFCLGDDTADENMFKSIYQYMAERSDESVRGIPHPRAHGNQIEGSLDHVFTCTVGKKPSYAHLYVNSVSDIETLLTELSEISSADR